MSIRRIVFLAALLAAGAAQAQSFAVGERVELEASGRWVPCVVAEPGGPDRVMRVDCEAYPALSRAAGRYIVHDTSPSGLRRRSSGASAGAPAAPARSAAAPAPRAAVGAGALKMGEYACYGVGGRPMIGLGFKVLSGNSYVDLDGKNPGRFSVNGGGVTFRGGHLDGQVGRELTGGRFRIGAQASCEPW